MSNADKEGFILHLFGWDKKFVPQFISFVQANFPEQQHRFLIYGDVKADELPVADSVKHYASLLKNIVQLSSQLRNARKIILHGLFSSHLLYILSLHVWLLKKCYWVIWGGDLYVRQSDQKNWRVQKNEFFRSFVVSRIGYLITYVDGDVELAREWYGARGEYCECIMYMSNVFRKNDILNYPEDKINILIGNSAAPTNNHREILRKLIPFRNQNIVVYAPLSYGERDYAKSVAELGQAILGEKFKPVLSFMDPDGYQRFLQKIDIAIFNHRRQQGMGNMISLLGLGKKVYLRSDVTSWSLFSRIGVRVFSVEEIELSLLDPQIAKNNAAVVSRYFSEENLVRQCSRIFR